MVPAARKPVLSNAKDVFPWHATRKPPAAGSLSFGLYLFSLALAHIPGCDAFVWSWR
jgi:hypothetical protein